MPAPVSFESIASLFLASPVARNSLPTMRFNVWGKRTGGDGTTQWLWDKKEFSAKLTYEPVSAEGPYLGLVIDSK